MRISLIVTTNDKVEIFKRLLDSIKNNNFKIHELIVIDQSSNNKNKQLIDLYNNYFKIIYCRTNKIISLSSARNIGIQYVTGDIIGFPDDDCWYNEEFFYNLNGVFKKYDYDMILTSVYDPIKKAIYGNKQSYNKIEKINKRNVIKYSTSVGIFIRSTDSIERFDERLGVGAEWHGGEDIDYVARYIYYKKKIAFFNDLKVYHEVEEKRSLEKEYKYSVGFGAVSKKMISQYKMKYILWSLVNRQIKSLVGIIMFKKIDDYKYNRYMNKFNGVKHGSKYK